MTGSLTWPAAPRTSRLELHQVDVWRIGLDRSPDGVEELTGTLGADELERAGRFAFPELRRRYVVGRAALRQILGEYASVSPERIRFTYGLRGKPSLREPADVGLFFNLAHSGDTALCAVTTAAHVGVDVERVRPVEDLEPAALAQQCGQLRNVRSAVARVRLTGARPRRFADDVARPWKQELRRLRLIVGRQQAARVVEMQVTEDDRVDVLVPDAARGERLEQHVPALVDAVPRL